MNVLVLRHFKSEIPPDLFILGKSIHSIMFIIPNRIRVACKPTQMYGFRSRFSFGREPNHQRPRIQQNTQLDGVEGGQKMAMVCLLFSEFIMWLYKKAIYDLKRQDNVLEIVNSGWLLNGTIYVEANQSMDST